LTSIHELTDTIENQLVQDRRDFHKYAESGWFEFRTASLVTRRLHDLGITVHLGLDVMSVEDRMGVPDSEQLSEQWARALAQGGDSYYLEQMKGGFTGVVGVIHSGVGPTVGLRFDMDALDISECPSQSHRPAREGFSSVQACVAHACGHDGHVAIGLGVAQVLVSLKDAFQGTVKLIFQPAEEGVRGAKSMVSAGIVDDVNVLLGLHLYSGWPMGDIVGGKGGFLATSKFDAVFNGVPAHAGGSPQEGKNALIAAANAVLNLYGIPRHRDGATRLNVGRLVAGTGRNVICPYARMLIETRGETTALNDYMYASAKRILESAAALADVSLEIIPMGEAQSANSDAGLAQMVEDIASDIGGFTLRECESSGGSEDFTYMMRRVQELGGLATNIGLGADLGGWGHHTAEFDFDERALSLGVELLSAVTIKLLGKDG
jgi:aminobenzoyl-glutamate utilization protein A